MNIPNNLPPQSNINLPPQSNINFNSKFGGSKSTKMFSLFSSPIILIIAIYTIIACTLWKKKPDIMFNEDGSMKPFGTGKDKTLFSYPVVLVITAITLFMISKLFIIFLKKSRKVESHSNNLSSNHIQSHYINPSLRSNASQHGGFRCQPCFYQQSFYNPNQCSSHRPMVF